MYPCHGFKLTFLNSQLLPHPGHELTMQNLPPNDATQGLIPPVPIAIRANPIRDASLKRHDNEILPITGGFQDNVYADFLAS